MAKITITVEMNERWISPFCSFLKAMENNGKLGHSGLLGFYVDGDGDFRPTFTFDRYISPSKPITRDDLINSKRDDYYKINLNPDLVPEDVYDAR